MQFSIVAERPTNGDRQLFVYDNATNTLSTPDGYVYEATPGAPSAASVTPAKRFSKADPLRKGTRVRLLKIQMGLSCNYACTYCSQRFVERADETSAKHVAQFLGLLDNLEFDEATGLKIEFWGGEPFVYWKTMKPLAEALRDRFEPWQKPPRMSVITNGSLLSREINDWLVMMGFSVAVSHDGPGQHVRGPDPLADPEQRRWIMDLYKRLRPVGRFSFNAVLNKDNQSRKAIFDWFVAITGDPAVPLGEGDMIDAYDSDGKATSLDGDEAHFAFRRQAFNDIFATGGNIGFGGTLRKIDSFTQAVLTHEPSVALPQKCGMDDEAVLAVDLRGNVITCQNVSAVATAGNGSPHLGGNIRAMDKVALRSATHWSNREHCAGCPVLHLCRGSCMYLEGDLWATSCANSYSDNIVFFALSFEKLTNGYIPIFIDGGDLPPDRRNIWGTYEAAA